MKFVLRSAVALSLLCVSTAAADPVTVTTGKIVFTDEPGEFHISGSGFESQYGVVPDTAEWDSLRQPLASGCVPGTAIDFGTTTYAFADFRGGGIRERSDVTSAVPGRRADVQWTEIHCALV